jgi:hypothetical protein
MFTFVSTVSGHTPLKPNEENNSLDNAFEVPNPTKSWTLYRELHEIGEVEYFKLHLYEGERFVVSVYTPRNAMTGFVPNLVVMGPRIEQSPMVPKTIETPQGVKVSLIEGSRPEAPEYEPFTPASYYFTAEYREDVGIEGDYYFAVYSERGEGKYGVAVGYVEEFTLREWLMIPIDVIGIHQWEGQSLAFILAPMSLTLAVGLVILFWRFKPIDGGTVILGVVAGLLYIGSGLMMVTQMFIALMGATSSTSLVLTLVFAILPIAFGLLMLRKIVGYRSPWTARDRVVIAFLGVLGLFLWAGLLAGPALAIAAGIIPVKNKP